MAKFDWNQNRQNRQRRQAKAEKEYERIKRAARKGRELCLTAGCNNIYQGKGARMGYCAECWAGGRKTS